MFCLSYLHKKYKKNHPKLSPFILFQENKQQFFLILFICLSLQVRHGLTSIYYLHGYLHLGVDKKTHIFIRVNRLRFSLESCQKVSFQRCCWVLNDFSFLDNGRSFYSNKVFVQVWQDSSFLISLGNNLFKIGKSGISIISTRIID